MDAVWDGVTRIETLREWAANARSALADAARSYNWPRVFELLSEHHELVNCCRPGGTSLYASLHQAAHGGAPVEVVQRLIEIGAWRTLRNARGERPIGVAERTGHEHLLAVLEPVYRHQVPAEVLSSIQRHFHEVIRGRAGQLVEEHALRLPELEPLLEIDEPAMWFPVPGMYGGFSYRLEPAGTNTRLVSESWSRVVGGSGQRHVITTEGSTLVEEGFV